MADTKVENETEIFVLDGDEYLYAVDDPSGTPTPSKVASRLMMGPPSSLRLNRCWGLVHPGVHQATTAQGSIGATGASSVGSGAGSNAYATTNERTRRKRVPQTTGTSSGSNAGFWYNNRPIIKGGAAGRGGFRFKAQFAINTMPASWRAFIGLNQTISAIGNVDPSSLTNMVCLGKDAADTAWQIMTNDGSGTATKVALNTTDFPINDTTAVFEVEFYCPPGNAQNITYRVRKISGVDANGNDTYSATATGTISADMMAVDAVTTWHMIVNNDVNASAAVIDMMMIYWEALGGS